MFLNMAKKTTVELTEHALTIKERFSDTYGLKNILSAGLLLFEKLEASDREGFVNIVSKKQFVKNEADAFLVELFARLAEQAPKHKRVGKTVKVVGV